MGSGNEILFIITFWAVLSAARTGYTLKTNSHFRFQWWEGGVMLTGKYLPRNVAYVRFVLMILLSVYSMSLALEQISFRSGQTISLVLLTGLFLMDLIFSTRKEPLVIPGAKVISTPDSE